MKALSVKQPWAYLLCAGIKDIENRTWPLPEKYKGEWVLIHASAEAKGKNRAIMTNEQIVDCIVKINARHSDAENIFHPTYSLYDAFLHEGFPNHVFSAIVGAVKFSECVMNANSVWAEKTKIPSLGDVLEDIKFLGKPIPPNPIIYKWKVSDSILFEKPILGVKGKLSFWDFDLPEEYKKLLQL